MKNIDRNGNPILKPSTNWEHIPLGLSEDGTEMFWETEQSNSAVIIGSEVKEMKNARSNIQRSIILHCLQHLDKWRVVGLDPKKTELTPYNHFKPSEMWVVSGFEESLKALRQISRHLNDIYLTMEEEGASNYKELDSKTRAQMIVVDAASFFLRGAEDNVPENIEIKSILTNIARMGRAAGIFLVLSTNDPEIMVKNETLMKCIPYQIFAGRQTQAMSQLLIGNSDAFDLDTNASYIKKLVKGGLVYTEGSSFQRYTAQERWFEDFLLEHYLANKK